MNEPSEDDADHGAPGATPAHAAAAESEEIFRACFNANRDDYMAYWDSGLDLKLANFQLDPALMYYIEAARDMRRPVRFEAVQNDRVFDFRAYPAMNALGECSGVALYAHDISRRKAAEEEAHRLAYFDPLTGLPNRTQVIDRLHRAVKAADRRRHWGALMFIDLDRFKNINDSLGHDVGDAVLRATGERLSQCRRDEDVVGRLGSDEFVWLLHNLGDDEAQSVEHATRAAERLFAAFDGELQAEGHALRVAPSLGIAVFGGSKTAGVSDIMKQADAALTRAKQLGSSGLQVFKPHFQEAAAERLSLEVRLHEAVERNALELHYQAQASLADDSLVGAETLLRWTDPKLGAVSPAKFIPIAEETGLIVKIGDWVLDSVCRQISEWGRTLESPPPPRIAVNISPVQFHQPDFVDKVTAAMRRWDVGPGQLELEVTESLLIEEVESTIAKMKDLRRCGVRFAIDDFGTGYSSLAYLQKLPLDILKIDQSFVQNVETDDGSAAIAASIITMAKLLEYELVAEGVETERQLAFLSERGCETYQGYLFSRPLPIADFEKLLGDRDAA